MTDSTAASSSFSGLCVTAAKANEQLTATGMRHSSFLKLKQASANSMQDTRRTQANMGGALTPISDRFEVRSSEG